MSDSAARVPVGVWDQVLAFGQYQHETVNGDPCLSIHDATTCKVMMDDFAAHSDCDIFYDKQHEVEPILGEEALDREKMLEWGKGDGHALAWANAMVMIIGGQVVRYESHPGAPPAAPRADDVLVQSDGTRRADGVYCLRSEVTPRGADPAEGLLNFKFTSPYYVPERDGNRLLNLTATNDPRMRGCALAFNRAGARIAMSRVTQETPPARQAPGTEERMDPKEMARLMEAAGCKAEDKPEEKAEKMAAYARKMEDDSKKDKDASEMARKKMEDDLSEMKRKMEDSDKERQAAARKEEDSHKEPDGDEAKKMQAMQRRIDALEEKNGMLAGELKEVKGSASEFQAMQREQKKQTATVWAKQAIAMRRVKPTRKGSVEDTEKWLTEQRLADPTMAEELLSDEGTFGVSEPMAMERHTYGSGAPVGAPNPREGMSLDDEMDAAISAQTKAMKAEGVDFKKVDVHRMAMQRIRDKNPNLYGRYARGSN